MEQCLVYCPNGEIMTEEKQYEEKLLPIAEIFSDPSFNCRGVIKPADIQSLAADIDENGQLQAICVQPYAEGDFKYRVVFGNRRYMAMCELGKTLIRAIIREDLDEDGARVLNIIENFQREDLTLLQEAKSLQYFLDRGWGEVDIAKKINASRGWVQVRCMLLKLPENVQSLAGKGILTQQNVRDVYTLRKDEKSMFDFVRKIKTKVQNGQKPNSIRNSASKGSDTKRLRKKPEIYALMEIIAKDLDYGLTTRAMAWIAGEITDADIIKDIKDECTKQNKPYTGPAVDQPILAD